ncbi:DnaJ-domain-containing protein [Lophium mytilinum]|uniref:DnaJ-domain-containing protein n=1 Tax=Lophium mytilinum TaxID=390894 RepID=A0A6A6QD71_9PEZI|nr:DnaJ-domain-containing protein [Lophium mytilinum]
MLPNPYSVLGVPQDVDEKTIRFAYRRLALKYHPDNARNIDQVAMSCENFKLVLDAYKILIDPEKRTALDHGNPPSAPFISIDTVNTLCSEATAFWDTGIKGMQSCYKWEGEARKSAKAATEEEGTASLSEQLTPSAAFFRCTDAEYNAARERVVGAFCGAVIFASNTIFELEQAQCALREAAHAFDNCADRLNTMLLSLGDHNKWPDRVVNCRNNAKKAREIEAMNHAAEMRWRQTMQAWNTSADAWKVRGQEE